MENPAPLGESKQTRCPVCEHATVRTAARFWLYLGVKQRCPECMAGWKFTWAKWLYHIPIALILSIEIGMFLLVGFGLSSYLVIAAVAITVGVVPYLLPLEARVGDPMTDRAIRRWKERAHPGQAV